MKYRFITMLALAGLFIGKKADAQVFTVSTDTVTASFAKVETMNNPLKNVTGTNLVINWHVVSTDFPSDWLTGFAFGICDNTLCLANLGGSLWDESAHTGGVNKSIYYANATHDSVGTFGLSMNLSAATTIGTHWMKVNVTDSATGNSKDLVFVINKLVNGVPTVSNKEAEIQLYPNPAGNEINVIYDQNADIKNIAVYNIIGKTVAVYKVKGNSARMNIENIPAGIYFVKLYNGSGNAVVTRKFTKQ